MTYLQCVDKDIIHMYIIYIYIYLYQNYKVFDKNVHKCSPKMKF